MILEKKLYKSDKKTICGVCAGIAEYFGCETSVVQILVILIALVTAFIPSLIVYFVLAMVLPEKSEQVKDNKKTDDKEKDDFEI